MHILMTGSDGQLGRALHKVLERTPGTRLTLWTIFDHDITDPAAADWIADAAPDVVVNAAAWTDVDGAEANPATAFAANTMGPKYLAEGCARCGAAMVQVSTNEVFPGNLADLLGKSPSGTVRGAALPVDQLTNDIGEKFRLVKRNKVAALVGEYLPAVCRQGGQSLLQF